MKDYYEILGVKEDASSEEIRERYVELAKLYHPDMKEDARESDRIKEINEAYEVLKNESTRMDYDLLRSLRESYLIKREKDRSRLWIKRGTILFVSFFIVLLLFSPILWKRPAVDIEPSSKTFHPILPLPSKEFEPETRPALSHPPAPAIPAQKPEPPRPEVKSKEAGSRTAPPISQKRPSELHPPVPSIPIPEKSEPETKTVKDSSQILLNQPEVLPSDSVTVLRSEKVMTSEEPPEEPPQKIEPLPQPVIQAKPEPMLPIQPAPAPVASQPEPPVPSKQVETVKSKPEPDLGIDSKPESTVNLIPPGPPLLIEREVRQFLSDYIDRYVRRDIGGFLALFSSKAIQNGRDGLDRIKAIYTRFFDQSESLDYKLENVKIAINGNEAQVHGHYLVIQRLKNRGGEKLWRGNLHWTLVKKDEVLKIVTLDYQHDQSH